MVSQELIELLKYMEHSTDEVSEQCKSERIQKMHRRVCRIKASEKTEVKYMQAWEEKVKDWEEGAKDKACQTAHNLYDRGFSAEDTSKIVEESLEMVRRWYQEWAGK